MEIIAITTVMAILAACSAAGMVATDDEMEG